MLYKKFSDINMEEMQMKANTDIPWKKIYDFTLSCGNVHELKSFSV